jgi:hypothetical protein
MIRYALTCANEDEFEGWFRNSGDFDAQLAAGELICPLCGSDAVRKAPMAPAVIKTRRESLPGIAQERTLVELQARLEKDFEYVGEEFADQARAMHEGDAPERAIWGEASKAEVQDLIESGAAIAALPPKLLPKRRKQLN